MLTLTKDRALALAMLALTGILLAETRNIAPPTSWQPYGSALFPQILLGIIAVLSLLLLLRTFFVSPADRKDEPDRPRRSLAAWIRHNGTVLSLFGLFGLYALLLPLIGYLPATLAFLVTSLALLLGIDTRRKWIINLTVSCTLAPLVYVIFRFVLNVWLP
ncbi:tripartite tricarboxylate transporter TctB family protein [Halomonas rhizosphaerae]|uniref:Tripartite tricarboxylate transporter TctB family protein n=1 Tax=Halomonas rhizosphaerae TaxID=3043296 RepID=A0ABT6UXZ2_9GAMM|nr:tripartite tricarboxylate transporter TctB family protein [Halomonas rhizosphaerae]MDI5890852.1 tripartite tricarboxylate transporter TctB family protein [Halomonas rhizosphaerae]MDI5921585.1 tripartite tricarboxylate transporter TctB family protein [Halomonas rhizosphaerae]